MNKRVFIVIPIVIGIVILGFFLVGKKGYQVLAKEGKLVAYFDQETPLGKGILYLPFLSEIKDVKVTASIDFNNDDNFSDEEKVATDIKLNSRKDWNSGVAVKLPNEVSENLNAQVKINDQIYALKITTSKEETGNLLDLASTTNQEDSMKGWGKTVYAQEPVTSAFRPGVSDITQRIAECAPTAAANSLISLALEHGKTAKDLPSPIDMIDELKKDMDWTPENGALPDEFVQGKNEWAIKHGLPIRTTKVGDKNGLSTLQQLLGALDQGAAAELRITFGDATTGKATGGHMVTVVGIRTEGGQNFIEINDPKTPEGTETYELRANVIEGYPYKGLAVLSWGFTQVWDEQALANLEPLTEAEIAGIKDAVGVKEKVKVINFRNKKVPISQVHVFKGPECDGEPHYHANKASVTALDGTVFTDPGDCGYGKVKDVPVEEVQVN